MSKCIGCPAAKDLTPDEVVATILGLTMGPNYRSELLTSPCTNFNHIHAFFLHICTASAAAAMSSKFGSVWQPVGPLKTIKFARPPSTSFSSARSRRGGLARVVPRAEEVACVDLGSLLID